MFSVVLSIVQVEINNDKNKSIEIKKNAVVIKVYRVIDRWGYPEYNIKLRSIYIQQEVVLLIGDNNQPIDAGRLSSNPVDNDELDRIINILRSIYILC